MADKKASEKDVANKVKQSGRLQADLTFRLASIEEKLASGQPQLSFSQQHEAAPKKTVRTKFTEQTRKNVLHESHVIFCNKK